MSLTGRIDGVPSEIWHDEVLAPQFAYEVEHLLPWYVAIEKVFLLEYARMGLVDADQAAALAARWSTITADSITADPRANMSDIAFALERYVADGPVRPFGAWHVDRSRNDLQATAQRMFGRHQLIASAEALTTFCRTTLALAEQTTEVPMPGHTHLQAAQVITPAFYLTAIVTETLRTLRRLSLTYDEVDECPLGAGAMAGQELDWDRDRMARLLGFGRPVPHALVAVASRGWALSMAADLSGYATVVSRFATDLMMWGSAEFGYIDLPDQLSGISSAMPQKKNFPVLERIRGRSAHVAAYAVDLAMGQRSTPYSNMVEVSKEAGAHLWDLLKTLGSTMRLFNTVMAHLRFRTERMRAACEREYLGGFTLANLLTLRAGVAWRTSQVIAGRYVVAASEAGRTPGQPDGALLATLVSEHGITVDKPEELLVEAFSVDNALRVKVSPGSTGPDPVRHLLAEQQAELVRTEQLWAGRRQHIATALAELDAGFGVA
ncbi:MAG TPA: lyase family protein [Micromonosporaceae bacterium]